jgi:hypothetical protein
MELLFIRPEFLPFYTTKYLRQNCSPVKYASNLSPTVKEFYNETVEKINLVISQSVYV